MKNLLLLLLVIPTLALAQNVASEDELVAINKNIFVEYALNGNTAPFAKATKEDFILIGGPGNLETKQQVIKGVKNVKITSLEVLVDKTIINESVGIVIGTLVLKGTIMGNLVPPKIRYSSVFVKEGEQLKLQSRTMTPVKGK